MSAPDRPHVVDPPVVHKIARVLAEPDWSAAWFTGPATSLSYNAEDVARCDHRRCSAVGDHPVPGVEGSCGFFGSAERDVVGWMTLESALLEVELSGRIVSHGDAGWRGSNQRVLGARFVGGCVDCRQVVDRPLLTTAPGDPATGLPVVPRCSGCAVRWSVPGGREPRTLADVAGLLITELSWVAPDLSGAVLRGHDHDEDRLAG